MNRKASDEFRNELNDFLQKQLERDNMTDEDLVILQEKLQQLISHHHDYNDNYVKLDEDLQDLLERAVCFLYNRTSISAEECSHIKALRIIWSHLSQNGKKKYVDDQAGKKYFRNNEPPLHLAVEKKDVQIVRVLVLEFGFNVNQTFSLTANNIEHYFTPLHLTVNNYKMTCFLLENGADLNIVDKMDGVQRGVLFYAVMLKNIKVVRLLLEHYRVNPNLNRKRACKEDEIQRRLDRCTDKAIKSGIPDTLRMLLDHDAYVGHGKTKGRTSLSRLLGRINNHYYPTRPTRQTTVEIVSILVQHAKKDRDTLTFLHCTLEYVIRKTKTEEVEDEVAGDHAEEDEMDIEYQEDKNQVAEDEVNEEDDDDTVTLTTSLIPRRPLCDVLLEGGVHVSSRAMNIAIRTGNINAVHSLVRHGGNPFLQESEGSSNDDDVSSPFLVTARLGNILLLDCFLDRWDECRFSKNHHLGASVSCKDPLHAICSDPLVSLQTIMFVVHKHQASSLTMVDNEQSLLPFLSAAAMDNLDATFYLLKHCPNALLEYRLRFHSVSTGGATDSGIGMLKKNQISKELEPGDDFFKALQVKNDTLQADNKSHQVKNESLQDENELLQQRLASLQSEKDAAQVEIESLRQLLAALQTGKDATAQVEM